MSRARLRMTHYPELVRCGVIQVIARARPWSDAEARSSTGPKGSNVPAMAPWPTDTVVAPSILSSDFGRMREQVHEVLEAGARVST